VTNSKHPILVFGATGRQGGSVAKALLKAGWPVRALVLDSTKAASLQLRNAGVELVQGSFEETNIIRTAMKDAYGVFSVLPANLAAEDEVERVGVFHLVQRIDGIGANICMRNQRRHGERHGGNDLLGSEISAVLKTSLRLFEINHAP